MVSWFRIDYLPFIIYKPIISSPSRGFNALKCLWCRLIIYSYYLIKISYSCEFCDTQCFSVCIAQRHQYLPSFKYQIVSRPIFCFLSMQRAMLFVVKFRPLHGILKSLYSFCGPPPMYCVFYFCGHEVLRVHATLGNLLWPMGVLQLNQI